MKKLIVCVVMLAVLCVAGCITSVDSEGKKTYRIDPNESAKYEGGAEGVAALLQALSPFVPYVGTGSLAILTALGIYRGKIKPKLETAQTEADLYHTSTHTLVAVIEEIKVKQPELWEKLKPFLNDTQMGQNTENVIRALRSLPPKS